MKMYFFLCFSFCAILRAAFLSDEKDAVRGTVKAIGGGVVGTAGGGPRRLAALRVRRVAVVRSQLRDVIRLSVRHLQVTADALRLSQRHVPKPLPDRRARRQPQGRAGQSPAPSGAAVLRLLPSRGGGSGGGARLWGEVLLAGQAEVAGFGLDVHLDLQVGAVPAETASQ